MPAAGSVALVTLGCARNEVDSEELAGRLTAAGWDIVPDPADADVALVNTCGFVAPAKKDSVDALLAAADLRATGTRAVVAVGCLAERYGEQLAEALPEVDAVLSFDDYPDISARLRAALDGEPHAAHAPQDRRRMLPLAPLERPAVTRPVPGHGDVAEPAPGAGPPSGPRPVRRRLTGEPVAPLKLASGCDRRCAFCAIPSFRGSFLSRPPADVLAEARWLAGQGVRELVLVSENSTSYGKDLGDLGLLERLLPRLATLDGVLRVRVSYLQPAEMRPRLLDVMTQTAAVAPYFDLSFQHASGPLLRRMRRFGDAERFLTLVEDVRGRCPQAGLRSNVIVGFPGETEADLTVLEGFLRAARLDSVGVFGYSDEEGTEAATLSGKLQQHAIDERVERLSALAATLMDERAEERVGETLKVLVEALSATGAEGRAAHQAPEVDGTVTVTGTDLRVGDLVPVIATGACGVDLSARLVEG